MEEQSPWAKIDEATRKAVIDTYLSGESIRSTAYLCAVSQKTARRVLVAAGVPRRKPGEWKKIPRKEVARLREEGFTQRDIADIVGYSPSGIRNVLKEVNGANRNR